MCELIATPTQKPCSGCGAIKSLVEFSPTPTGQYGRHSRCKVCRNKRAARLRAQGLVSPMDKRFKRSPQPFVQGEDGTFDRVKPAPRPAPQSIDQLLRDHYRAVARAGDAKELSAVVGTRAGA